MLDFYPIDVVQRHRRAWTRTNAHPRVRPWHALNLDFQLMHRFTSGWVAAFVILFLAAVPVWAHHTSTGAAGPRSAIVIPSLSHGQMGVVANYRSEVMALADDQFPTDATMRRLESFINLQRFVCLWGMVPGSITDENSPFNECAHAYLSANRALLLHLLAMPGNEDRKQGLFRDIELAMLEEGASLVLCRYSDEPFNTGEVIGPNWRAIAGHLPSFLTVAGFAAATLAGAFAILRRRVPNGDERPPLTTR